MSGMRPQERFWIFPKVNRPVFIVSAALIIGFILFGALFNDLANTVFTGIQGWLAGYFGWAMIILINLLLVFVIFMGVGPFGDVRLGRMDENPEYSLFSWTAMLFSAGIGIGLIYWGVAEPMYHYFAPPMADPETVQAAQEAMAISFMHWGFHAWGIYAVVALALAYFHFRKGLPLAIRSALYPLIGDRIYGFWGDLVDIVAVFGTMFGIVTSLGLGATQVNAGLNELFGVPNNVVVQILIIAAITGMATLSVVAGLDGGIKRLSNINIILTLVFLAFMVIVGPTLFILDSFVDNYGYYLSRFIQLGTWNEGWQGGNDGGNWQESWTIFYWAWWVSWAPFVGVFVARISRGRTVREFMFGVMLLPCSIMFFWFTAFGGTAISISLAGDPTLVDATRENYANTMFALLDYFPFSGVTSLFATILIVMWFVTSSDSGSFVIDMLTAGGDPNPPKVQRIFWAVSEGAVASVLLLAGGLGALQAAAVIAGFPFAVVLCLIAWGLVRALRWDNLMVHRHRQRFRSDAEAEHNMGTDVHDAYAQLGTASARTDAAEGAPAE
ncbi:choline/glycine/proline betaine transport protein [Limimaricola soesokkakensis]|uniref:Choline/glycine/proline betaine transport protein n=1 Tax=Limimaricola soesokkakensis TaxID=1343159 RepID=A0A1X6ZC08_9RHOB|nr:BCCT family transporter [Limimaricola soesokkakensis]PSK86386.1 choline/glycine/proline betaine transport protein [Limimaricola soesokkakensis]SLN46752.1 Glycine betaine transporter OpuD [Limimaricola soesokkakensis]